MTETLTLAQATDTQLADLYGKVPALEQRIGWALDALHRAAGDKRDRIEQLNKRTGRWTGHYDVGPWGLTEAEARLQVSLDYYEGGFRGATHAKAIADLDEGRAALHEILTEAAALEAIHDEHGWSRFFLVRNHGGHIHSSMVCSTCFLTTSFGWLPQLSGLTEADAVAAHGAMLCTVCFPSAPVEWTDGRGTDDKTCPGSGKDFAERPTGRYGKCAACGKYVAITRRRVARKHNK